MQIFAVSFSHNKCVRSLAGLDVFINKLITGLQFLFESQGFEPLQSIPTSLSVKAREELFRKLIW